MKSRTNKLFYKLFLMNNTVVFICLGTMCILLFALLGPYFTENRANTLMENARNVADMTMKLISSDDESLGRVVSMYAMTVENISVSFGSVVVVLDKDGNFFYSSNNISPNLDEQSEEQKEKLREAAKKLVTGKEHREFSKMGGFFKDAHLCCVAPMIYSGQVMGAVVIATPTPELDKMKYGVFRMVALSSLVTITVTLIMSYFFSLSIVRPIRHINNAAKRISNGDFDRQVTVSTNDEIAELADTFNQMVVSLRNLDNMKSSFISNVSHELRTPMTSISGFVEGILDGIIPTDKQRTYLEVVLTEIKRLSRLVNDLMEASRIEEGNIRLSITQFDVCELVRLSIIRFENRISEKRLSIDAVFSHEKIVVKADKDAIFRVLINLFDNAIKFTPEEGWISVNAVRKSGVCTVCIRNSGEGVSKEEQALIWDRFYKIDKSRSEDKKGIGLGLYIVSNIMKLHEQQIKIDSKLGEWTEFSFTLDTAKNEE